MAVMEALRELCSPLTTGRPGSSSLMAEVISCPQTHISSSVSGARQLHSLPQSQAAMAGSFSVYDIVNCDHLILTEDAVKAIEEVYA